MIGTGWRGLDERRRGLRRFALAITLFVTAGHLLLGFEQAPIQPLLALAVAYAFELLLEALEARVEGRTPRYTGGPAAVVDHLTPAHITALAVSMLLYANARVAPMVFAVVVALASKRLLRVPVGGRTVHVLNPSNAGITVTLLLFPWVGIAPPYMFTTNLTGAGDALLPAAIVLSGTALNARYTKRLPLLFAWLTGFLAQALLRSWLDDTSLVAACLPMTGVAFLLFSFYMVTDPPTTPRSAGGQLVFGSAVAAAYGVLMSAHVVFGLFFGLSIVCVLRAILLATRAAWATAAMPARRGAASLGPPVASPTDARVSRPSARPVTEGAKTS